MFRLLKANSIPNFTIYLDKARPVYYFSKIIFQPLFYKLKTTFAVQKKLSEIIPNIQAQHTVADVALVSFFIIINAG